MQQQTPRWLDAAITAAGMTVVYNADDWTGVDEIPLLRDPDDTAANDPTAAPH